MNIASLCKRPVVSIDAAATLRQAASLMREQHVGALVVTAVRDEQAAVIGVVTDRDMALEVLSRNIAPVDVAIGSVASQQPVGVRGSAGIDEALGLMAERGVRRLLVTDDEGRLTGVVSSDDILEALAGSLGNLARALRMNLARESVERRPVPPAGPRPVFLSHGTPGMH
jgi:CBS domain-containing protein